MFSPEDMHTHLARLERELNEEPGDVLDNDELLPDNPTAAAKRIERFTIIKELLTTTELHVVNTEGLMEPRVPSRFFLRSFSD